MRSSKLVVAAAALVALAGCNGESPGGNAPVTAEVVPPPPGGDWSTRVSMTPEGGFLMGNPNAAVKLVEFGSMTCPHCAAFDEEGAPALIENYVKKGQVSFEFRNYVRDSADMAASLIARCGGTERFFPVTRQLFEAQREWTGRLQQASPEQYQAVAGLPPSQMFVRIGELAGLQQWAAQRGIPSARANQCLGNEQEVNRLVQMTSDAGAFNVPGTPAFLINGELVDGVSSWQSLEPQIRKALG